MIFRGLFFFYSIEKWDVYPATLLNIVVYSLVHLLKSKREAIASIPIGVLMCYVAWLGGSFWYAAIAHIILAIAHDIFSIRANPNMRFKFSVFSKPVV